MNLMDVLTDAVQAVGPFLPYAVAAGLAVVAVGGLVFLVSLVVRAYRDKRLDNLGTMVATGFATAFSAEGMWEVATEGLHMQPWQAVGLFAVLEVAMTCEAIRARRRMLLKKSYAMHAVSVWAIAAVAGGIAALNADTLVEVPVRLCMPLLAAWLWWTELRSHGEAKAADKVTWRLTVSRLLVKLRLAEPGSSDIATVDRTHRSGRIAVAAYRTHHASKRLRNWNAKRLRKLTLGADAGMVTEAIERLARVYSIEQKTAPEAFANTAADVANDVREQAAKAGPATLELVREHDTAAFANTVEPARRFGSNASANGSRTARSNGSKQASNGSKKPRLTAQDVAETVFELLMSKTEVDMLNMPTIAWIREETGCGASTAMKARDLLQRKFSNVPGDAFANGSNEPIANDSNTGELTFANGSNHGTEES